MKSNEIFFNYYSSLWSKKVIKSIKKLIWKILTLHAFFSVKCIKSIEITEKWPNKNFTDIQGCMRYRAAWSVIVNYSSLSGCSFSRYCTGTKCLPLTLPRALDHRAWQVSQSTPGVGVNTLQCSRGEPVHGHRIPWHDYLHANSLPLHTHIY